jgi:PPIC-type PPIASE domain
MKSKEASQISDKDIEAYYQNNVTKFETAEMDRIYIPKNPQPSAAFDTNLTDAEKQHLSQESERTMKAEADSLCTRAAAGEEFPKLQEEAYQVAGIKSAAPDTGIRIRRISLPPGHVSAMDLNPGQVSSVLPDPNGYVIYKLKTKNTLPLDQAREEIKATLRSQRMHEEMDGVQESVTSTLDDRYFQSGAK